MLRTLIALSAAFCAVLPMPADAQTCQTRSGATPPLVVELYTSEGCSSCPPADRWLSTLRGRADVLPLAFHVTYWDRLGWPDRFAAKAHTERQHEIEQRAGSRQVYTPQVLADGQDWRRWPALPALRQWAAAPGLSLQRQGDRVSALVAPQPQGAARLAGYWAVLEDGHASRVAKGENAGETLRHDHVVRLYQPVALWAATAGATMSLQVSRGVAEHPRRVAFVVTDAASGRPLQALALAC
ncbi:MAG: DUF1223 domain-containing protein [Rubrivivax sp.]